MRSFAAVGALLAMTSASLGADYLRGTHSDPSYAIPSFTWEGAYAGAFASHYSANFDPTRQILNLETQALQGTIVQPNLAGLLRLNRQSTTRFGGGIFLGYNWQFEDVVYGIEGEANLARLTANSARTNFDTFNNVVPNTFVATPDREPVGTFTETTTTGTTTNRIRDYAIIKARAGYAMGRFMPYATIGLGIARVQTQANVVMTYNSFQLTDNYSTILVGGVPTRNAFINRTTSPIPSASGVRVAATSQSAYKPGVAVGIGMDWAPTDHFFLRAEYQAFLISNFERVDFQVHSARIGGGVKF